MRVPPVAAGGKVALHVDNIPVGTARFSNVGSMTTVTTGSARTIINYSYLNVGAGATLTAAIGVELGAEPDFFGKSDAD